MARMSLLVGVLLGFAYHGLPSPGADAEFPPTTPKQVQETVERHRYCKAKALAG